MSKNKERAARLAPKEDRDRAAATLPSRGWWVGALLWSAVAVAAGVLYRFIAPVDVATHPDRLTLVRLAAAVVMNSALVYWSCYFTARQSLARRPLRELLHSEHQRRAVNRFGLPLLLPVAALIPFAEVGGLGAETFTALIEVGSLFCIYRALTTAYTDHYFDYVVSPSEKRTMDNDELLKGKGRRRFERLAMAAGLRFPRHSLVLPTLQTLLVAFALQQAVLLGGSLIVGPSNTDALIAALGWVSPAFPVLSVLLWARWHLAGGLARITRIGAGRPMKSFGWQHPELAAAS